MHPIGKLDTSLEKLATNHLGLVAKVSRIGVSGFNTFKNLHPRLIQYIFQRKSFYTFAGFNQNFYN